MPATWDRRRTANREDGARLDNVVQSFWGTNRQHAFLMSGFSALSRRAVATPHLANVIVKMSWKSEGPMMRE